MQFSNKRWNFGPIRLSRGNKKFYLLWLHRSRPEWASSTHTLNDACLPTYVSWRIVRKWGETLADWWKFNDWSRSWTSARKKLIMPIKLTAIIQLAGNKNWISQEAWNRQETNEKSEKHRLDITSQTLVWEEADLVEKNDREASSWNWPQRGANLQVELGLETCVNNNPPVT